MGAMRTLGELERDVMNQLWTASVPLSVRMVMGSLPNQDLAYTTVMTVLDRLSRKELVTRTRSGRAFLYSPAHAREELTSELMSAALDSAGVDRTAALVHFTQGVTPEEAVAMRAALDRIVAKDNMTA
jgi:predicted transcriptional regulator